MQLQIEKMRRELFGSRSERSRAFSTSSSCNSKSWRRRRPRTNWPPKQAAAKSKTTMVAAFTRKRPSRKPFPDHLPRERVVIASPTILRLLRRLALFKLGEDVTETLEVVPRQWKVIQHVREKFSCRDCESITQAPAPFHVFPRGWAGPSLLAMIVFEKFGQHQPLNRQAERYAREGVPLSLSTLADQVGACVHVLRPIFDRLEAHVLGRRASAWRRHDGSGARQGARPTRVDVGSMSATTALLADQRRRPPCSTIRAIDPASIRAPSGELCRHSASRRLCGLRQALRTRPRARSVTQAACWAHARRKFFVLADVEAAAGGSRRARRRSSCRRSRWRRSGGSTPCSRSSARSTASTPTRKAVRAEHSAPLVADLHSWMREERAKLSRHNDLAKAMDYMLKRWDAFARFLDDGRICLSNNAAERALRGIALGRSLGCSPAPTAVACGRRPVQPHRHREDERRRSAGVARRRAGAHRRSSCASARRTHARNWAAERERRKLAA